MKTRILVLAAAILSAVATSANAQLITAVSASASPGLYVGSPSLLINGVIPTEGSLFVGSQKVTWASLLGLNNPVFTVDYGATYQIRDVLLSIDNNDRYRVQYSLDGSSFTNLFTVQAGYGEISSSTGGMDTMSSDSTSPEYVSQIDFAPVNARYLRLSGSSGDGLYAAGEIQAFGIPVPEPSTYGLIAAGLLCGLVAWRRRSAR